MGWNRPGYIRKQKMKRAKKELIRLIIKMQTEGGCGDESCGADGHPCQKSACAREPELCSTEPGASEPAKG